MQNPLTRAVVLGALLDGLALVLPTECACCGAPDRAVCPECAQALAPSVTRLHAIRQQAPPLAISAALPYREPLVSVISQVKEHGRTDVVPLLSRILSVAIADARLTAGATDLVLAPTPSSRAAFRSRGYNPVALMVRRARSGLPVIQPLRVARTTRDQAGLGVGERRANLDGSLRVRTRFSEGSLQGLNIVLVDDVVTTGATLLECRRALEAGGARVLGAATLAFAERRAGRSSVVVQSPDRPD